MAAAGFVVYLIFMVISFVFWYFMNRASVRANRQVQLLESINEKLSQLTGPDNGSKVNLDKSAEGYLEEARKKAGL
ncbi:YebO family protein [Candidatus Pantoea multigeneris]|uniref:Uncharacterized protein n=1 Tax=Candidatus Pantoea multigeneris TaxID=2608357 RepID=A0ABX0RBF8_9GAMM|nr:hypothetical protein [Pantoea multigeneris]